jgi:hypothetical protein
MTATLTVRDATCDGRAPYEWRLDVAGERLTVRELIRNRICREVADYNARRPHTWRGLVQPAAEERHGGADCGPRPFRPIDADRQCELACEAFRAGRLLILVGDIQADELDEEFALRPGTAVTFLRLALLVGG